MKATCEFRASLRILKQPGSLDLFLFLFFPSIFIFKYEHLKKPLLPAHSWSGHSVIFTETLNLLAVLQAVHLRPRVVWRCGIPAL